MKAISITRPFETEILDLPDPVPAAGEALLRILYCGICGADVASFTGNQPFTTYPRIPDGRAFRNPRLRIRRKSGTAKKRKTSKYLLT